MAGWGMVFGKCVGSMSSRDLARQGTVRLVFHCTMACVEFVSWPRYNPQWWTLQSSSWGEGSHLSDAMSA